VKPHRQVAGQVAMIRPEGQVVHSHFSDTGLEPPADVNSYVGAVPFEASASESMRSKMALSVCRYFPQREDNNLVAL